MSTRPLKVRAVEELSRRLGGRWGIRSDPRWVELESAVFAALVPYPAVRRGLDAALSRLGSPDYLPAMTDRALLLSASWQELQRATVAVLSGHAKAKAAVERVLEEWTGEPPPAAAA